MTQYWMCLTCLLATLAAWDFGRRWLSRQDYRADLTKLHDQVEANKIRNDKAISNLAQQTQETMRELDKKQNAILSGNMIRGPGRRSPMIGT